MADMKTLTINGTTYTVVDETARQGVNELSENMPTKTSQLTNDSGFLTSVPVSSVNNKTGAVQLGASDVGALPLSGGTMTGSIRLGQGTGKGIDIGGEGRITLAGNSVFGIANNEVLVGSTIHTCKIRGIGERLTYNGSNMALQSDLNRSTAVNAADTNYTTLMARGTSLHDVDTTPAVNGAICWTYK